MHDNYPPGVDGTEPQIAGEVEMKPSYPRVYREVTRWPRKINQDERKSGGISFEDWFDACGIRAYSSSSSKVRRWYNDDWSPEEVNERVREYES